MTDKIEYSCRRKKDYVSFAAVFMFCIIVAFELYLIFILPIQLSSKNAMRSSVARQRMTAFADSLRSTVRNEVRRGDKSPLAQGESELVLKCLDQLAFYVRANQKNLSPEQVYELQQTFMKFSNIVDGWKAGRYHIVNKEFNADPILKKIESSIISQQKAGSRK